MVVTRSSSTSRAGTSSWYAMSGITGSENSFGGFVLEFEGLYVNVGAVSASVLRSD